jgi:hypothetical protein
VLREHLTLFRGCTLNKIVSASIEQEDACRARMEEERKKRPLSRPTGGPPPKYRLVYTPSFRPATWSPSVSAVKSLSTSAGGPMPSSLPVADCSTTSSTAYRGWLSVLQLRVNWDFARECPQPRQGYTPRAPSSPSSQQKAMIHPPSLRVGHANFTTVEEIPPGEEVLAGMFFLVEHPIIILFDSGASHDFMSLAYAQKAKLTLCAIKVSCSISTPEGRVVANRMVCKIPLKLVG